MSKFLNIPNGDYKIKVKDGGNIVLDPGSTGEILITGNLQVLGNTTTVDSSNTVIGDNIITLNSGEIGAGVTSDTSGIEVDRGTLDNVYLVFDETNEWTDPSDGITKLGDFSFINESGDLVGIRTSSITSGGGVINFLGEDNAGSGILYDGYLNIVESLDNPYSERILNYSDPLLAPIHSSAIPNVQAMVDYVDTIINTVYPPLIEQLDTKIEAFDFDETGTTSRIEHIIDGTTVATMYETETSLYDILISGSTLESTIIDADFIINTSGTGSVKTNAAIELEKISTPAAPVDGTKVYSSTESGGGSGVYFVNESGTDGELVSTTRSILYGMLFS